MTVRWPGRVDGEGREAVAGEAGDWWELSEEGTIVTGERTGETIRLGGPVRTNIERVRPRGAASTCCPSSRSLRSSCGGAPPAREQTMSNADISSSQPLNATTSPA